MRAYQRFLEYVQIYTTSDPAWAGPNPSTQRQFTLARLLVEQMKEMGIEDARVDEKCYVYGSLPATAGLEKLPAMGFIAHMDTAPSSRGEGVKPILHHNYNGQDVVLPNGHTIPVSSFSELKKMAGETLITASGDTLLGADDKAGIAEILTAAEEIIEKGLPHGRLCIGFTPDEEIGAGANGFDVPGFGAQYAYTVDGGDVGEITYETFNAAEAKLYFTGVGVHPGSAKNIMVNANKLAIEFDALLPQAEGPEKTEGREGFYHLTDMQGTVEQAYLEYIIRDHDRRRFEQRKQTVQNAAATMQQRYGAGAVKLVLKDSYYNMGELVEQHFHLVENARKAIENAGLAPDTAPVRGGTDGSRLSFMGLPCPNLGTGGFYFHGPNECITVERMDKAVQVLLGIVQLYAEQ
ncbi:MAG: peptidase T [Oscillospiraceae bacterium]